MTLKPAEVDYMISTSDVGSAFAFGVSEFQANSTFDSLINIFCLTTTDDILFALEWSSDSVHQLLWKTISKKSTSRHPKVHQRRK